MKLALTITLMLGALSLPVSAQAGNVAVTGGTNGPLCNSGGYFTPSQTTIAAGDTITFSVPSNDPYSGGLQIHGFPEGNFTVLPGGSHTTAPVTASVNYYGTWPSSGCMKGSGSVTVNAPNTPAPTTPAPARASTSTTATSTTKTSTSSTTPSPSPTASPSASVSPSSSPSATRASTGSLSPTPAPATVSNKSGPSLVLAARTGALGLGVIVALIGLVVWAKRRAANSQQL